MSSILSQRFNFRLTHGHLPVSFDLSQFDHVASLVFDSQSGLLPDRLREYHHAEYRTDSADHLQFRIFAQAQACCRDT